MIKFCPRCGNYIPRDSNECPRCKILNDPASNFCSGCSLGLDEKTMIEYDNKRDIATKVGFNIDKLMDNDEFKMELMNLIANKWGKLHK